MKRIIFVWVILLMCNLSFSTRQYPDKLIIGDKTFLLHTFPLDDLMTKNYFKIPPFKEEEYEYWTTACYRGYVATWRVFDNKLLLVEVEKMDSGQKLDIENYLIKNGYTASFINGNVFADWYSDTLKRFDGFKYYFNPEEFWLIDWTKNNRKIELIFENGILTCNNISSFESYKTGDTLTKEISYYRHWILDRGLTNVKAVIIAESKKKVLVKIIDYGTTQKKALKNLKQMMGIRNEQKYWINPRYWDKKE